MVWYGKLISTKSGGSVMSGWVLFSSLTRRGMLRAFVASAAIIVIGACASSSSLVNVWKDSEYRRGPMHAMFVVALKRNALMRRTWEDGFVTELGRHGVTATP